MTSERTPPDDPSGASRTPGWAAEAASLAVLYVVGVVVYLVLAHKQSLPIVVQDEFDYGRVARSIADGEGKTLMGGPYPLHSALYLYTIAPAWLGGSTTTAYEFAKAIGTILVCLTVIPTWLLGRELLGARLALIPSALVLAGSWMSTAALLLTENLAFPLSTAALAATVMALRRPATRWGWVALAFAAVASAARMQCAVLVPILFAALLVHAVVRREGIRAALLRDRWLVSVTGGVTAAAALVSMIDPGVLGIYSTLTSFHPSVGRLLSAAGHQTVGLVAMTAILPVIVTTAGSLRRAAWTDEDLAALLVVTWVASLAFILESTWLVAAVGTWHIERYVEYPVPIILIATVVIVVRGHVHGRDVAGVTVGLAVLLFFAPAIRNEFEERAVYALDRRFDELLGSSVQVTLLVTTLLVGAAGVLALSRPAVAKRGLRLAGCVGVIAVVLLVQSQADWSHQLGGASANRRLLPEDLAWVDHAAEGPVANLIVTGPSSLLLETSLFNRRLTRIYWPARSRRGAGLDGLVCPWAIADSGALAFGPACGRPPRRFLLNDGYGRLTFYDQTVVRGSRYGGRVATVPGKPRLRAILLIPCARQQRWRCAPAMSGQFFLDAPGTLIVRFRGGTTPQTINTGTRNVPVPPGAITTIRLPVPKGASSAGLRLSWRGPSPALTSAVLVQGPLRTPLL